MVFNSAAKSRRLLDRANLDRGIPVPDGPSAVRGGRADVFAYFNSDVKGHAIRNAADQNITS